MISDGIINTIDIAFCKAVYTGALRCIIMFTIDSHDSIENLILYNIENHYRYQHTILQTTVREFVVYIIQHYFAFIRHQFVMSLYESMSDNNLLCNEIILSKNSV